MLGGRAAHVALSVLLLAGSALVAAGGLAPSPSNEATGSILVGDLKLSDADESPRETVSGTFGADNLAPGDASRAYLGIHRETDSPTEPALEPHVDVEISQERASPLGERLLVNELTYGGEDLRERARQACGEPLTLDRLASCSRSSSNPMSGLEDPGPEGKRLWLGVVFDPQAETGQDEAVAFSVQVELRGEAVPREPASTCRSTFDSAATKPGVVPNVALEPASEDLEIVDGVEAVDADRLFAGSLPSSVCQTPAVSG